MVRLSVIGLLQGRMLRRHNHRRKADATKIIV